MRGKSEVADERLWHLLRARYLRKDTVRAVFAAQEQALRTRFFLGHDCEGGCRSKM